MRAVNLLPRDEARQRFQGARIPLLAAGGAIVVVSLASFALAHSASTRESEKRAEEASVRALIARLPKSRTPTISTSVLAQERTQRLAALSTALRSRTALDKLLRQVSQVLPENAWLTGFKAAAPAAPAPAAGGTTSTSTPSASADQGVTVEGATYSQEAVAHVLSRLALIPALENIHLTSSAVVDPSAGSLEQGTKKKKAKTKKVVAFTITASVRAGVSP